MSAAPIERPAARFVRGGGQDLAVVPLPEATQEDIDEVVDALVDAFPMGEEIVYDQHPHTGVEVYIADAQPVDVLDFVNMEGPETEFFPEDRFVERITITPEADGGSTIEVRPRAGLAPEVIQAMTDALENMSRAYRQAGEDWQRAAEELAAQAREARQEARRAALSAERSMRATAAPRDARGRFRRYDDMEYAHFPEHLPTEIAPEYHLPVNIQTGDILRVPGGATYRQWTGGTPMSPVTYTEVAAPDEIWHRWGGWTYTLGTASNTVTYNVQADPQRNITGVTYATTTAPVWRQWVNDGTIEYTIRETPYYRGAWDGWVRAQERVERDMAYQEERERRQQEARDRAQREAEARSRRRLELQPRLEGARDRARELLRMILTPEERLYLENTGDILVRGSDGGMYVVQTNYYGQSVHGNVYETDEHGCNLGRVCVAPGMMDHESGYALPKEDGFVGQVLAIRHQEADFRRVGNWSHRQPCQHEGVPIIGRRAS